RLLCVEGGFAGGGHRQLAVRRQRLLPPLGKQGFRAEFGLLDGERGVADLDPAQDAAVEPPLPFGGAEAADDALRVRPSALRPALRGPGRLADEEEPVTQVKKSLLGLVVLLVVAGAVAFAAAWTKKDEAEKAEAKEKTEKLFDFDKAHAKSLRLEKD